ncbi:hypothetical protein [Streptomyces huiliensis]|uniref:hypothetical protein n=1 Tax=Streptomyces huiliensis TaxID=2876027 RepID=UPI001CBACD33|nr:hypothetical protein [Streptomyces huiliensis]MBZ4320619.1 hypothetical protein [Streptomyces huiliensis]
MNLGSAWLLNSTNGEGGQSRLDTRLAPLGAMVPAGPLASRPGVLPGSADGREIITGLAVSPDGAGMSTRVSPGRAVVQGTAAAGAYPVYLSESASITFGDGDPGNRRVDLVVVRVYDDQQDASGKTGAFIEVVPGVPAAKPVAPPVPPASLPLAEVTVKAGASAGTGGIDWRGGAVRDRRQATVAAGGIIPADRGAGFDGTYPGQYRDNGAGLQRWNGKEWQDLRPTWQSYAPTWGAEIGDQPSIGNGRLTGRYLKDGPQVQFYASLTIDTTSKFTSANSNWYLTLPFPPSLAMPGSFRARTGSGPGAYYFGGCYIFKTTPKEMIRGLPAGTGVARGWTCPAPDGKATSDWVDATHPTPPQPGSWYEVWGTYEVDA